MLLSNRTEVLPETLLDLLCFIVSYGDEVFPNLRISLQILLTIAVSTETVIGPSANRMLILSNLRDQWVKIVLVILHFLASKEKHLRIVILTT